MEKNMIGISKKAITTRRSVVCALAFVGFAASAQAADMDLGSLKDPLPDTITWKGVTVYGTIDVGYGYQTNGNANSGALYTSQAYNIYGNSLTQGSNSSLTNSALSQSFIGVKAEENIGLGLTAIFKLETGFNPISGEIADACASLVRAATPRANNVINGTNLTVPEFGDGSRCGQAINGEGYAGLSSAAYGTLKIGRQNSLDLDAMAIYDPMGLSYAMSLIGWSGGPGGGVGSTETARWDNSIKYTYQYGPVHASIMYADGEQDSSIHGSAIAGDIGASYRGFSVDAVYTNERGAVNGLFGLLPGLTAGAVSGNNQLYYWLSNNEAYSVMGKYTFDLGGCCGYKDGGGLKDAPIEGAKLTFYGGYQHTDMTNYDGQPGGTTIGGYQLSFLNNVLTSTRTLETAWAGAKYETGPWTVAGAYYWLHQNNFTEINLLATSLITPGGASTGGCAVNKAACSGDLNQVSFLVDYAFNKHFDVYGGVTYQDIGGGLAHSFLSNDPYNATNNTTVVTGMRLKF
jgi:predicted porin